MNAPTTLDELPVEIIRHIASSAAASSALSLSATCHTLRASCWDSFIFRQIIEKRRGFWPRDTFETVPIGAQLGFDTVDWARYALADQYAGDLRGGLDGDLCGEGLELALRWAPYLVVCNHPFTTSMWLAFKLSEVVHGQQLDIRAMFLYAATMLSTDDDGNDMVATSADASTYVPSRILGRTRLKRYRALGGFAVLLRQAIRRYQLRDQPGGCRFDTGSTPLPVMGITPRVQVLTQIPGVIGAALAGTPLGPPAITPSSPSLPLPPSAIDIPLAPLNDSYKLPVPFDPFSRATTHHSQAPWDIWLSRHVDALSQPSFLTNGKWVGYFLDRQRGTMDFHPMFDITFTCPLLAHNGADPQEGDVDAAQSATSDFQQFDLDGLGADSIGAFTLFGQVHTLGIDLRKQYVGAHAWHWSLSVTPFGLFGTWGPTWGLEPHHDRGAVYLWKEDWRSN